MISTRRHLEAVMDERDRRYAEVNIEREKALKIKEEADKTALGLAREIQTYKDEKANELRSQIEREQGERATKDELRALGEKIEAKLEAKREVSWGHLIAGLTVFAAFATIAVLALT